MANGTARGVLRIARQELYAQYVAAGIPKNEAFIKAGYKAKQPTVGAAGLERSHPQVLRRIDELLRSSASKSELSRREILDRIFQDWELARKLGQVPAALKAAELMGKEMHRMFVERKEVGGPGDFDNKSEEELREIIAREMRDLGWDEDIAPPNPSAIN